MTKRIRKENGAIAIEAIIGLSFFMVSVIGIMCMSLVARVQAYMQYALDQTAKEISGYYYVIDKVGLASLTTGVAPEEDVKKVDKLNGAIGGVVSFAGATKEGVSQVTNDGIYNPDSYLNLVQSGNAEDMVKGFQDMQKGLTELKGENPMDSAKAVIATFAKTSLNKAISKYVASPLCRAVIYRYLGAENQSEADQILSSLGVRKVGINEGDSIEGLASVDFSQSCLLEDGRSIKLVAVYTIDAKDLTLGVMDTQWQFRQVASTAAWIEPEENSSKKKLNDIVVGE